MSTKFPLTLLVLELSETLRLRNCELGLEGIPREHNQLADDLTNEDFSKFLESGEFNGSEETPNGRAWRANGQSKGILHRTSESQAWKQRQEEKSFSKTKEETRPLVIGALVILKGCNFQLGYHSQMVNWRMLQKGLDFQSVPNEIAKGKRWELLWNSSWCILFVCMERCGKFSEMPVCFWDVFVCWCFYVWKYIPRR